VKILYAEKTNAELNEMLNAKGKKSWGKKRLISQLIEQTLEKFEKEVKEVNVSNICFNLHFF